MPLNLDRTLGVAVRSICLQTMADWELILHDDGSTDGSAEIAAAIADPRVRVVARPGRRGRPACLNEAIDLAQGRYLAVMDADDIAYPERLERQLAAFENQPELDLVGSPALVFDEGGAPLGKRAVPQSHREICRRPWSGFGLWQPTFFGRIEWFRRHRYDVRRRRAQDFDLLLRSYATSRFANADEILLGYREGTISVRKSWRSRYHIVASLTRGFTRRRRPDLALRGTIGQVLKGTVDGFAVASGLGYRVLRHRARPLSDAEKARWREVWTQVAGTGEGGSATAQARHASGETSGAAGS